MNACCPSCGQPLKTLGPFVRFPDFWAAYPARPGTSKVNKKGALAKWRARHLDDLADVIIADVELRKKADARWIEGYIPDPVTYLNQDRWADDKPEPQPSGNSGQFIHSGPSPIITGDAAKRREREALEAMQRQHRELGL